MAPEGGNSGPSVRYCHPSTPWSQMFYPIAFRKEGSWSPLSILADGFVKITGHNKGPRSADGEGANTHGTPLLTPHSFLRKN